MSRKEIEARKPVERVAPTSIRLDKFLKISRIIKRRSVANDACSTGHVTVNGKEGKPGTDVRVGDILGIRFGDKYSEYEILSIAEHAAKQDAAEMYRARSRASGRLSSRRAKARDRDWNRTRFSFRGAGKPCSEGVWTRWNPPVRWTESCW